MAKCQRLSVYVIDNSNTSIYNILGTYWLTPSLWETHVCLGTTCPMILAAHSIRKWATSIRIWRNLTACTELTALVSIWAMHRQTFKLKQNTTSLYTLKTNSAYSKTTWRMAKPLVSLDTYVPYIPFHNCASFSGYCGRDGLDCSILDFETG